jgi:uncharacterized membrane protein YhaH (DUF805 family)
MLDRDYFFSFEGRAPRSEYWLFIGISIGYIFLMEIVVLSLVRSSGPEVSVEVLPVVGFPRSGGPFEFPLFVLSLPLYWPALAIGVRRLHDRNQGSVWAWLLLGVPMLAKLTMVLLDMGRMNLRIFRYPYFLILTASVAVSVWALVELGFLRGAMSPNSGQDPAGLSAAGVALMLASLAVSIWAFVELYCLRGMIGDNRFGPDPLADRT